MKKLDKTGWLIVLWFALVILYFATPIIYKLAQ
jgi:hypothetical protein